MKRIHKLLLAGVAISMPMLASADPGITYGHDMKFRAIYPGETKEEVRSNLGSPYSRREQSGETHYYYRVTDNQGEHAWLDVAFDPDGYVVRKGELRMMD